jgi:hypothetical protein
MMVTRHFILDQGTSTRRRAALAAVALLLGCGGGSGSTSGGAGGGDPGTISGKAGGKSVDTVAAAYFIGQGDDPAHTTVVYVFDTKVSCADLGAPGWDQKISDATGALEMKLIGTAPGKYAVAPGVTPAQGQASVNFTVSSTASTPVESASNSGAVQLDTLDPEKLAGGSFDLQFADGTLKGTFAATWCPDGHEP